MHSFRHFNATQLLNAGVDIKTIQSCLGHSTATTTLQIYCHEVQEAQVRAMEAVADLIDNGLENERNKAC